MAKNDSNTPESGAQIVSLPDGPDGIDGLTPRQRLIMDMITITLTQPIFHIRAKFLKFLNIFLWKETVHSVDNFLPFPRRVKVMLLRKTNSFNDCFE